LVLIAGAGIAKSEIITKDEEDVGRLRRVHCNATQEEEEEAEGSHDQKGAKIMN
jgi:hypothetical protein